MEKFKVTIKRMVKEDSETTTFYLDKPENMKWAEGAHTHIALPGYDSGDSPNKELVRHMSILTLPDEGELAFSTRLPGSSSVFKETLSRLKVGDSITLFKIGEALKLRRNGRGLVLISMGIGMAAMRPLIKKYVQDQTGIPEIYSLNVNKCETKLFHIDIPDHIVESTSWLRSRVELYTALEPLISLDRDYCIVGSDAFAKDVAIKLVEAGVKKENLIFDMKEEKIEALLNG